MTSSISNDNPFIVSTLTSTDNIILSGSNRTITTGAQGQSLTISTGGAVGGTDLIISPNGNINLASKTMVNVANILGSTLTLQPSSDIRVTASKPLRFYNSTNGNFTSIQEGASTTVNKTYTLPLTVPSSSGQFLTSDTSGNLSWGSPSYVYMTAASNVDVAVATGSTPVGIDFPNRNMSTDWSYNSTNKTLTYSGIPRIFFMIFKGNLFNNTGTATRILVGGLMYGDSISNTTETGSTQHINVFMGTLVNGSTVSVENIGSGNWVGQSLGVNQFTGAQFIAYSFKIMSVGLG